MYCIWRWRYHGYAYSRKGDQWWNEEFFAQITEVERVFSFSYLIWSHSSMPYWYKWRWCVVQTQYASMATGCAACTMAFEPEPPGHRPDLVSKIKLNQILFPSDVSQSTIRYKYIFMVLYTTCLHNKFYRTFLMGIHINGFVIIGDLVAAHCHKVPAFQTSTVSNQKEGEKRCCDKVETYHKLCTRANNRIISL